MPNNNHRFVFFGTDTFSTIVLQQLQEHGFTPRIVVCAPDKPAGRGQHIQKPASKLWAEQHSIPVVQPTKLDAAFVTTLQQESWDFFVVASYGKIIPQTVLDIPRHGTLNVHPSLLPLYRGASPIESAMLDDARETGVTILLVDAEMDHGPILSQEIVTFDTWPTKTVVEERLATIGGTLLAQTIEPYLSGDIDPQDQDHATATFTKKLEKEMGHVANPATSTPQPVPQQYELFLKIQALHPWPGVFFFLPRGDQQIRVKITSASWSDAGIKIETVIPEGKKEMSWVDFQKGFLQQ